jgi:hypothetical protein
VARYGRDSVFRDTDNPHPAIVFRRLGHAESVAGELVAG